MGAYTKKTFDPMLPEGWPLIAALSVLLCWPMLFVNTPLVFFDSEAYFNRGHAIADIALRYWDTIFGGAGVADDGGALADARSRAGAVRSIPYSMFVHLTQSTPLGFVGVGIAQNALILFMLSALVGRIPAAVNRETLGYLVICILFTALPWFGSYAMPDILAAGVVIYALILAHRFDFLGPWQRLTLALLTTGAIACHYGTVPLALGAIGAALGLRLLQRRLTWRVTAFGIAPIILAMAANFVLGLIAFQTTSVAPKRLPVLLARSLEDGPARWHLQEHCDTYHYKICDLVDEIPDHVGGLLFSTGALSADRVTPEDMRQVRAEELTILRRAFMEYPLTQTWWLLFNSADQFISFGLEDIGWAVIERRPEGGISISLSMKSDRTIFVAFNIIQVTVMLSGFGLAVWLIYRRRIPPEERPVTLMLVLLAALGVNAAIFGGLSEPADRYQTRLVWLIPVLAGLFWLKRLPAGR